MKIGFASLIGVEPTPFDELVRRAAALDLTSIEVNVGPAYRQIGGASFPGHLDVKAIVEDGPGPVQELLDAHGVEIASLAPMLNLLTANQSLREERIAYVRLTIDACVKLGVGALVTFCGSAYGMHFWGMPGVGDGHPSSHVADNLLVFREVYGPVAAYAEERGVRIAFETAGRGGPEGNLAQCPELWDAMFETVPSPALGLSFDPSHLIWLQIPDVPGVIRAYGDRIYHVDGKDCEILPARLARQGILGSSWWRYRLPGLGALDWTAIFSALREVGYDDIVAIENEDPIFPGLDAVAWSARFLRDRLMPTVGSADRPI
ncbi:MAG: sugar phosphate isomerase/epimerase family protein [Thermomicrobiales bacterium]